MPHICGFSSQLLTFPDQKLCCHVRLVRGKNGLQVSFTAPAGFTKDGTAGSAVLCACHTAAGRPCTFPIRLAGGCEKKGKICLLSKD